MLLWTYIAGVVGISAANIEAESYTPEDLMDDDDDEQDYGVRSSTASGRSVRVPEPQVTADNIITVASSSDDVAAPLSFAEMEESARSRTGSLPDDAKCCCTAVKSPRHCTHLSHVTNKERTERFPPLRNLYRVDQRRVYVHEVVKEAEDMMHADEVVMLCCKGIGRHQGECSENGDLQPIATFLPDSDRDAVTCAIKKPAAADTLALDGVDRGEEGLRMKMIDVRPEVYNVIVSGGRGKQFPMGDYKNLSASIGALNYAWALELSIIDGDDNVHTHPSKHETRIDGVGVGTRSPNWNEQKFTFGLVPMTKATRLHVVQVGWLQTVQKGGPELHEPFPPGMTCALPDPEKMVHKMHIAYYGYDPHSQPFTACILPGESFPSTTKDVGKWAGGVLLEDPRHGDPSTPESGDYEDDFHNQQARECNTIKNEDCPLIKPIIDGGMSAARYCHSAAERLSGFHIKGFLVACGAKEDAPGMAQL